MAFLELLMRLRNPFLDYLSLGISYLGTPFLVVGVITFLRFNDDQNRADGMMLAFLFSGLLCQGLKIVFHVKPDLTVFLLNTNQMVFLTYTAKSAAHSIGRLTEIEHHGGCSTVS